MTDSSSFVFRATNTFSGGFSMLDINGFFVKHAGKAQK